MIAFPRGTAAARPHLPGGQLALRLLQLSRQLCRPPLLLLELLAQARHLRLGLGCGAGGARQGMARDQARGELPGART